MISAADMQDVGWPDADLVVVRSEWMRNSRAFSRSCSSVAVISTPRGVAVMRAPVGQASGLPFRF